MGRLCILLMAWLLVVIHELVQNSESSIHLCPNHSTYIKSGDQCLFVLDKHGNFSANKKLCRARKATLFTVSTVDNLKDLCKFARDIFPKTGFAFFNAYKYTKNMTEFFWPLTKKRVDIPRQYWMDLIPQTLPCLELFYFANYCRLNDIVCWKSSWPVCEIRPTSPCRINNGGCQDICIPRDFYTRTCKCKQGIVVNETKCVQVSIDPGKVCPIGFKIDHRKENCFRRNNFLALRAIHAGTCYKVNATNLSPNSSRLSQLCGFLRSLFTNSSNIDYIWMYNFKASTYCRSTNPGSRQVLDIKVGKCCLNRRTSKQPALGICQTKAHDSACKTLRCDKYCNLTVPDNKAICTCDPDEDVDAGGKCVDKCEVNNGGCHHLCQNSNGGVTCSCKPGFYLNTSFDTECGFVNECQNKNGGCHQICKSDWDGNFWCECRFGYILQLSDRKTCLVATRININLNSGLNSTNTTSTHTDDKDYNKQSAWFIYFVFVVSSFISILFFSCIVFGNIKKKREEEEKAMSLRRIALKHTEARINKAEENFVWQAEESENKAKEKLDGVTAEGNVPNELMESSQTTSVESSEIVQKKT